jgi:YfiH family protein
VIFNQPNLICAFSNRVAGNMSLVYGDTRDSLENRKNFLRKLDIDYRDLVCAKQIHASNRRYAQEEDKGKGALSYDTAIADTDALITDKKNLSLAIFTADCLVIFLYDPKKPAVGLIHTGWRSTKADITPKTLFLMQEIFNTNPAALYVGFGPAIRDCCYQVGKDFSDYFTYGLEPRDGNYYLDLAGINKKQLLDAGVKPERIFDTQICTSCRNTEFFSYRKEGSNCGRAISVIMLR